MLQSHSRITVVCNVRLLVTILRDSKSITRLRILVWFNYILILTKTSRLIHYSITRWLLIHNNRSSYQQSNIAIRLNFTVSYFN